jgi:hypothetical protein
MFYIIVFWTKLTCSLAIVTSISDYRRVFGLVIGFIGLLVQSLVITINYNSSQ